MVPLNFEEHIRILVFFLMGLAITFIVAFALQESRLWLSVMLVMAVFVCVVIVLARSKDEIGKTD